MIDFSKIKTYSIKERTHKEKLVRFKDPNDPVTIIDNDDLKRLAQDVITAVKANKKVIVMIGGHVIKTGMSPYIIDLMKKGVISHVAMNGSTSIHDFEIALIGETSEDVEAGIQDGTFGMVEETGQHMNDAIQQGAVADKGYGFSIGKKINDLNLPNKEQSIHYQGYILDIPITVHSAIGTDTIHQHPKCDGAALGKATFQDFNLLTESIGQLDQGVVINIGSAVMLPETFLKALTIARNLGYKINNISAANLDMIDHYRPRKNVVERPVAALGGKGYIIIELHEKTVPSLYKLIIQGIS